MRHLEDHEFADAVEGFELGPDAAEHLASCVSCRRQVEGLREAVAQRRGEFERQEPDWERQHDEIMARLQTAVTASRPLSRRWVRPLLAAAAVVVVAVGLNSLWDSPVIPQPSGGSEIEIEEILAEVDAVLADDSLPGFDIIDPGMDDPESLFENGSS